MKRQVLFLAVMLASGLRLAAGQQLTIGIPPVFDAGSDQLGPTIAQHLALDLYGDLRRSNAYRPILLAPGGVYSSLDTSWLIDYVGNRQDIDLLLVATLKPNAKGGAVVVDVTLLKPHSGDSIASWTATSEFGKKGFFKALGATLGTQNDSLSGTAFASSELGGAVARLAGSIRDTLPSKTSALQPLATVPVVASTAKTCAMQTRITYAYKHAVSRSYTLQVNELDQTSTIHDGVSSFQLPEGLFFLQFNPNDAPYNMSKQSIYQLSDVHSCDKSTLTIDLGKQGEVHLRWE